MAITLRTVTGSQLTHEQLDANFASLIYSGSVTGNTLTLHYTSSEFSPSNLTLPIVSSSYAVTSSMTTAIAGITGYIPMFSGSRTLENSNIYQGGGRVGINTDEPKSCAVLDIVSKGKGGLLLPVVTTSQMNSISDPQNGLLVYDSTVQKVAIYSESWKYLRFDA